MKQQFLNDSGLTELIGYIKKYVKDDQDVKPYASLSVFPKTGEQNIIYIDTTTNSSYYWDNNSKTYKALDVQTWANLTGKPSTFPPSTHTHDDRYYTETEMNTKLAAKANSSHTHKKADITDFPTSMPASDVPAWAKAATKPSYTKAEVGLGSVDNTADKDKSVKYATSAGSASTAGSATNATTATMATKLQTYKQGSTTETYGTQYPLYAQWEDSSNARLKVDNYTVKVNYADKAGSATSASSATVADSAKAVAWGNVSGKPSTFPPSAHTHTKSEVGLGNVDNTADANKSVKYAVSAGSATTATTASSANAVAWGNVTGKPSTYPASSHTHDDRYYTEGEINTLLNEKAVNKVLTNEDLNAITTPGFYSAGGGNTVTNKPSDIDNFGLIVIHKASGSYYTQILFYDTVSYRRICANGTWGSWTQDKLTDTNTWRGIQNNLTSDSTTDSLSAAQGKALKTLVDGKSALGHKHTKSDITNFPTSMPASDVYSWAKASTKPAYSWSEINNKPSTFTPSSHTHGSGDITSLSADKITGVIGIDHLPAGALERCKIVADDTARFKLTKNDVQNGDTVKVGTDANAKMYFVIDDTKLSSEAGYTIYTAGSATSVPWSGVTGKPSTFTPSSHTHDDRYYTESEMNTKLAGKSDTGHTHSQYLTSHQDISGKVNNNANGADSLLSKIAAWTATPTDDTYFIRQDTAGTNTFGRVKFSTLWNYVNNKANSVYQAKGSYASSSHTHDDRYYTESEVNTKLNTKVDNTNAYRLKTFDTVPKDADLNTYLTPGTYGQADSGTAQTIKNLPYSSGSYEFKLIVEYFFNNAPSYIMQKLYRWNSCEYYIRESTDAGKTWQAWKKFAKTTDNVVSANTATALTTNAGSTTQPVYFSGGKPVATTYTLGASVPAGAKFTDTNTWRGIQNNLTSDSTSDSLAAAQGKALKALVDGKAAASHTHTIANITGLQTALDGKANSSHSHSYLPLSGGTLTGALNINRGSVDKVSPTSQDIVVNAPSTDETKKSPGIGFHIANKNFATLKYLSDGSFRFYNSNLGSYVPVYASTFYGNLSGNASTATNVAWSGVTGKPSTFTPSSHTHTISNITGLQSALDGKAASSHSHSYLPLSGGTITGTTNFGSAATYINSSAQANLRAVGTNEKTTYLAFPGGGGFVNTTSVTTGYLKITLPQSWTSTMMSFKVKIYEYRDNTSCEYMISGYNYADGKTWVSPTVYSLGKNDVKTVSNYNVRFGHDGSKCAVYIGESDTKWNYVQVQVCDFLAGFQNYTYSNWASGWSVGFTTTLGTITKTISNPNVSRIYQVSDVGNGANTTFAYSKSGMAYADYTWLAAWNGNELRAVNKTQFAQASHSHTISNISDIGNASVKYATSAGSANAVAWANVSGKPSTFAPSTHTHSYAGSSSAGGAANSTNAINWVAGNEIRFTKPSSNATSLHIGYKWADGTLSKLINEYIFDGGDGNKTQVTASQFNGSLNGNAASASSVPWSGITGKPSTFTPSTHTHGQYYDSGISRTANTVLAAPNGSNGSATFRKLVEADIPSLSKSKVGLGNVDNTADSAKSVKYATSAGSVAWGNVSGRPSSMPASDVYSWAKASSKPSYSWSEISGRPSSLPASDVYAWAKASSKPSYAWSEISGKPSTFTPASHSHTYIEAKQIYAFTSSTLPNSFDSGISTGFVNSDSGFGSFGSVLTVRTYSGGGGSLQLYAPYSATYGGTHLKARFGNYDSNSGNSWTTLKDIAWTSDIPTNTNQLTNGAGYITSSGSCKYADSAGSVAWGNVSGKPSTFTPSSHTHSYAGSSSAGGSANSAVKLDTATAGSATQPVYFTGGKPAACSYTLGKSVPSNAVFTDTNTWRPVVNNLVSTATDQSLSANQGKVLKDKLDALTPVGYIFVWSNYKSDGTAISGAPDLSTAEKVAAHFGGGTWARIDGKFLYGYTGTGDYALGKTGGAATVSLSTANLPSHSHSIPALSGSAASAGAHTHTLKYFTDNAVGGKSARVAGNGKETTGSPVVNSAGAHTHTVTTKASTSGSGAGTGTAHNNMPPFMAVYIWQRVA